jgi:hypothetical protein
MGNDPKIHDYSDLFACRAPPQGLRTADEAAAKLRCSIKTLRGHVRSGALRYVVTGHGIKHPHKMFTDADIDEFIANQTRLRNDSSGTVTGFGWKRSHNSSPKPLIRMALASV